MAESTCAYSCPAPNLVDVRRQELEMAVDPLIPLRHLHISLATFLLQAAKAAPKASVPGFEVSYIFPHLGCFLPPEAFFLLHVFVGLDLLVVDHRVFLQPVHHALLFSFRQGTVELLNTMAGLACDAGSVGVYVIILGMDGLRQNT